MPLGAGLDFSDYITSLRNHAWLLEDITMGRLGRFPRYCAWYFLMATAALIAFSGCGDTSASPPQGGDGNTTTATSAPGATPASIPGWQNYTDAAFHYAVQYPPGWTALQEPQPQGAPYEVLGVFVAGSENNGAAPTQNVITITASQGSPDTVDTGAPPGFAPSGSVTVAGTSQSLLIGPGASGGQGLLVMFAQDDALFAFYSTADDASAASFRQTFTQILSTFRLTTVGP